MKLYAHRDILKIFPDLKTRTLISWSEKGLFSPEIDASGTGSRRLYSRKNLVEIGVIRELISYRFSHDIIRPLIEELNDQVKKYNFDMVIVARRQIVSGGYVTAFTTGPRKKFAENGAKLIFGEQSTPLLNGSTSKERALAVGSAIVVSLADIWEFIKKQV